MGAQIMQRDVRRLSVAAQIKFAVQQHQVLITVFVLGQKNQRRGAQHLCPSRLRGLAFIVMQINLTADNRLNACPAGGHRKL